MLQAILSAVQMRPYPSARSPLGQRIPRHIVLGMADSEVRHNQLGMVSNVRRRAGLRTKRSRIGGFEGFRRHTVGSVRSRTVPLCDARVREVEMNGSGCRPCNLARILC
jgi:hypothetical protein